MPRLISYKLKNTAEGIAPRASDAAGQSLDQFLEAITKLVPVEIIAVYMLIRGLSPSREGLPAWLELVVYGALIALTTAYLNRFGGSVPNKRAQIAIGTISFVIWTYGIGGSFFWPALEHLINVKIVYSSLAGILVLLWSLVTGLINPGAPPGPAGGGTDAPGNGPLHGT